MTNIPDDIMKAARDAIRNLDAVANLYSPNDGGEAAMMRRRYDELKRTSDFGTSSEISRAEYLSTILQAEKRGEERERDRCLAITKSFPGLAYAIRGS